MKSTESDQLTFDVRAEESVIAALLFDHTTMPRIIPFLVDEDFYNEAHDVISGLCLDGSMSTVAGSIQGRPATDWLN